MVKLVKRTIALAVGFCLIFEQTGFAQAAPQMVAPAYLNGMLSADRFRPLHLRSLSFEAGSASVNLMIDKGDIRNIKAKEVRETAGKLMDYFKIGLALPNSVFWVNLRPDAPQTVIDPSLERTDAGKILLAADLQLKKDLARFSSPDTSEGKKYWDSLYEKIDALFGKDEEVDIPTFTRPWIVPAEIIIGDAPDSAYIYKATLKVCLEQDYISGSKIPAFADQRFKELNDYSSRLVRELILPRLTREVNSGKDYAGLRQVYYSLVLAQWFKAKSQSHKVAKSQDNSFNGIIDTKDLSGLTSKKTWSKDVYYQAYRKSFSEGEYNKEEEVESNGRTFVRRYTSGGIMINNLMDKLLNKLSGLPAAEAAPEITVVPVGPGFTPDSNILEARISGNKFELLNDELTIVDKEAVFSRGTVVKDGGRSAIEPDVLIAALKDESWGVREDAAEALGKIREKKAVDSLLPLLSEYHFPVRHRAAWALGEIRDVRAVDGLIEALNDENYNVRWAAAEALGKIRSAQAVYALTVTLRSDRERYVRLVSARSLGEIQDKSALPHLYLAFVRNIFWGRMRVAIQEASEHIKNKGTKKDVLANSNIVYLTDVQDLLAPGNAFSFHAFCREMFGREYFTKQIRDDLSAAAKMIAGGQDSIAVNEIVYFPGISQEERQAFLKAAVYLDNAGIAKNRGRARVYGNNIKDGGTVQSGKDRHLDPLIVKMISLSAEKKARLEAIKGLGELGDKRAEPALVLTLMTNLFDRRIRNACLDSLAELGSIEKKDGGKVEDLVADIRSQLENVEKKEELIKVLEKTGVSPKDWAEREIQVNIKKVDYGTLGKDALELMEIEPAFRGTALAIAQTAWGLFDREEEIERLRQKERGAAVSHAYQVAVTRRDSEHGNLKELISELESKFDGGSADREKNIRALSDLTMEMNRKWSENRPEALRERRLFIGAFHRLLRKINAQEQATPLSKENIRELVLSKGDLIFFNDKRGMNEGIVVKYAAGKCTYWLVEHHPIPIDSDLRKFSDISIAEIYGLKIFQFPLEYKVAKLGQFKDEIIANNPISMSEEAKQAVRALRLEAGRLEHKQRQQDGGGMSISSLVGPKLGRQLDRLHVRIIRDNYTAVLRQDHPREVKEAVIAWLGAMIRTKDFSVKAKIELIDLLLSETPVEYRQKAEAAVQGEPAEVTPEAREFVASYMKKVRGKDGGMTQERALEILGGSGDYSAREQIDAIKEAEKMGETAAPLVLKEVFAWNDQVSDQAVATLGKIGMPVVRELIKIVDDPDYGGYDRSQAVRALGTIGVTSAIDVLIDNLWVSDVKEAAADALAQIGKPAIPALIAALTSAEKAEQAANALRKINDPSIVDTLSALLQEQSARPFSAIRVQIIAKLIDDLDQTGIGRKKRKLVDILLGPGDHSTQEQVDAIKELAQDGEAAAPVLLKKIFSTNDAVGDQAAESLGSIGKQVVPELIDIFYNPDEGFWARENAAKALGLIGDPRAIDKLVHDLWVSDVKEAAADALARIGKPAVPALIEALLSQDKQEQAARALRMIGDTSIIEPLTGLKIDLIARGAYKGTIQTVSKLIEDLQAAKVIKTDAADQNKDGGKKSVTSAPENAGGIDFRALPVTAVRVSVNPALLTVPAQLAKANLNEMDRNWGELQRKIQSGPVPFRELQGYVAACSQRKDCRKQLQAVSNYIFNVLKLEEQAAVTTAPEMKEILGIIS